MNHLNTRSPNVLLKMIDHKCSWKDTFIREVRCCNDEYCPFNGENSKPLIEDALICLWGTKMSKHLANYQSRTQLHPLQNPMKCQYNMLPKQITPKPAVSSVFEVKKPKSEFLASQSILAKDTEAIGMPCKAELKKQHASHKPCKSDKGLPTLPQYCALPLNTSVSFKKVRMVSNIVNFPRPSASARKSMSYLRHQQNLSDAAAKLRPSTSTASTQKNRSNCHCNCKQQPPKPTVSKVMRKFPYGLQNAQLSPIEDMEDRFNQVVTIGDDQPRVMATTSWKGKSTRNQPTKNGNKSYQ